MTTQAETWWADVLDPDKTEHHTRRGRTGLTETESVKRIHALVRHGYHHTTINAALARHLAEFDTRPADCPHGPGCDPSTDPLNVYLDGPDGPEHLICLTHQAGTERTAS